MEIPKDKKTSMGHGILDDGFVRSATLRLCFRSGTAAFASAWGVLGDIQARGGSGMELMLWGF